MRVLGAEGLGAFGRNRKCVCPRSGLFQSSRASFFVSSKACPVAVPIDRPISLTWTPTRCLPSAGKDKNKTAEPRTLLRSKRLSGTRTRSSTSSDILSSRTRRRRRRRRHIHPLAPSPGEACDSRGEDLYIGTCLHTCRLPRAIPPPRLPLPTRITTRRPCCSLSNPPRGWRWAS